MMKSYDTKKPVILLATGPSARHIKRSDNYYTSAINLGTKIQDHTDFWIINDANTIPDQNSDDLSVIDNLVIPEFPHSVLPKIFNPSKDINYECVTKDLPEHIKIWIFNIQTAIRFDYNKSVPMFNVTTSGESAFMWLNHMGFNKIVLIGFDPDGGSSKNIACKSIGSDGSFNHIETSSNRYSIGFNNIRNFGIKNNMKIVRLVLSEGVSVDDEIINQIDWSLVKEYKEIKL